jgi:hypothetical protein
MGFSRFLNESKNLLALQSIKEPEARPPSFEADFPSVGFVPVADGRNQQRVGRLWLRPDCSRQSLHAHRNQRNSARALFHYSMLKDANPARLL